MDYWVFWLCIVIFLSFVEVATINLTTIWFVVSAIVSLFVSLYCNNFTVQFTLFGVIGLLLLIFTKPLIKKYIINGKKVSTNLDRVIGMKGVVTSDIDENTIGEVKIDGKRWSAISNMRISKGEIVIAKKIEGVKLVVEKKESDS